ncbi:MULTISPECIES: hypothetical protein [unclassified Thiocapsa]|uniref:hypothetical protein n=1 Tax=unclassified Thiocapsa TaxID=2641286 RepID=UPI0035AE5E6F
MVTCEVLLASACLPQMFQAIEIDTEAYRDGGSAGNPTILPLVRECTVHDCILVQISPVERPGTPQAAQTFLTEHGAGLGVRASYDLSRLLDDYVRSRWPAAPRVVGS